MTRLGRTVNQYVLTGREKSLEDVESIFRSFHEGETFELRIPKKVRFKLFREEPRYQVRHSGGSVDFYPYHLPKAVAEREKYLEDGLRAIHNVLYDIHRARERGESLPTAWKGKYFFTVSPTSAESSALFHKRGRLTEIVDRVNRMGRYPFAFVEKNGDVVVTNQNFLKHLKSRGTSSVKLYRGHNSMDTFFYRLLLGRNDMRQRKAFADWLEQNAWSLATTRRIERSTVEKFALRLRDRNEPLDAILGDLTDQATSAAMFTSLTNQYSMQWAQDKDRSEILTLNLDLKKVPEWYLDEVLYGADLDTEVVFPYTTQEQRDVLRRALKIEKAVAVR